MTLKELFNEWLNINHKDIIKPKTYMRYEQVFRTNIYPYYGDENIEGITGRDILRWINEMRNRVSATTHKPLSSSSINTGIQILKMCFRYALDFELLDKNPMIKIKNIPNNKERNNFRVLTKEEQIRLEKCIESKENDEYFIYILTLYTGLRLGEVMGLTWKNVNIKTGVINICQTLCKVKINGKWTHIIQYPKTKNSLREIPLPKFITEKLKEMKTRKKSKYVVSHNDGSVMSENTVVERLYSLEKKLRIKHMCFHGLRHTFATRALESGMDIKTLSEILGHADVSTTLNIYTHSLINHKRQQMRKIKRLI